MKNKEIEELLNELKRRNERYIYCKNNDISFSDEDYKSYLLLSYIEQLEKDKKELKDGWQQEIYDKNKVLNDWLEDERKINVLENNRDKAIEYFKFENPEIFENPKYTNHLWTIDGLTIKRFIDILKGDSE